MTDLDDRTLGIAQLLEQHATTIQVRGASLEQVKRRARQRRQRRVAGIGVLGAAASLTGLAALAARDGSRSVAPADDSTSTTEPSTSSIATTDTTIDVTVSPAPGVELAKGATGADVVLVQDRLRTLGFDPGPSDGTYGDLTEQAVWAFEGIVLGRPWSEQTGRLDRPTLDALFGPDLSISPRRTDAGDHTEVYLDLQALVVFHGSTPVLVTHISSGSGETWCELITQDTDDVGAPIDPPTQKNVCGVATTPGGVFKFYRTVKGNRQGPLGGMYNPVYFNYGIAVAGADNVPREPVSHGAIRIPMTVADYFPTLVNDGDRVYVWDGIKEPEQQRSEDMLPTFNYPNPADTTPQLPASTVADLACATGTYTIVEGDTPLSVAKKFDLTLDELTGANTDYTPGFDIFAVGTKILIPPAASNGCGATIAVHMNPAATAEQLALVRNALDEVGTPIDRKLTQQITSPSGSVTFLLHAPSMAGPPPSEITSLGPIVSTISTLPMVIQVDVLGATPPTPAAP